MSGAVAREVDLRSIDLGELVGRAEALLAEVAAGEALTVLAGSEVVVHYLVPNAATAGLRCRVGPPVDGVWRIDLSPRTLPAGDTPRGVHDE